MTATPMRKSWLIQRLNRPRNWDANLGLQDNPFAFGGGLKDGGLSSEAMDLLRGVWSFDYMGSAEFEFGAVPKALNGLAELAGKKGGLSASSLPVDLSTVELPWDWPKGKPEPSGEATVYIVAPSGHLSEVKGRIAGWVKSAPRLKESLRLSDALVPTKEWHKETCGWLELDNGFLFFTDEAMFSAARDLFGVSA